MSARFGEVESAIFEGVTRHEAEKMATRVADAARVDGGGRISDEEIDLIVEVRSRPTGDFFFFGVLSIIAFMTKRSRA